MRYRSKAWWVLMAVMLSAGEAFAALPWQALTEGNSPWRGLQQVRSAHAEPGADQLLVQLAAIAGDEASTCTARRRHPVLEQQQQWRAAIDAMSDSMATHRVVLLNESHERSRHRAFLEQMIVQLHALGFRAMAAETFAVDVVSTTGDGQVRSNAGVYTRDPVFAAAVERALALGWELVPYEPELDADVADRKAAREQGQAEALAHWLGENPQQKLLVYVGGSHLDKRPDQGWMAARLTALTGHAPLSIRQGATACPQDDPSVWPVPPAAGVTSLVDTLRAPTLEADWVVVHLPLPDVEGRPGWLAQLPGRQPVTVCLPPLADAQLLRAFEHDRDDPELIAADQFPLVAGQAQATLFVPAGRYRVELETGDGTRTRLGQVTAVATALTSGQCLLPQ